MSVSKKLALPERHFLTADGRRKVEYHLNTEVVERQNEAICRLADEDIEDIEDDDEYIVIVAQY